MANTVIRVENLGKKYIIGHQTQERYSTLRDAIANRARSLTRKLQTPPFGKSNSNPACEEFWALKDVSFEIKQGDRVGIIGRNGAGKSTLLKVLSRITEPTIGRISIKGRVASLLEVGTGFHPELTGRENIYLNGAILGMSKVEIRKKFEEIVAFAEVERFLDTPVKRYSSGMYVRLAFAVAAHLEPEILIVDEVLAVGDTLFQKKCLGKMNEVAGEGRTVFFVSHNMATVAQLCTQAIYLEAGKITCMGNVDSVVSKYLMADINNSAKRRLFIDKGEGRKSKNIFFKEVTVINHEGTESTEIDIRYPFYVNLEYEVTVPLSNVELSMHIETSDGRRVFRTHQSDCSPESLGSRSIGNHQVYIKLPGMFLMPGSYLITIAAHKPTIEIYEHHNHVLSFNIIDTGTRLTKYQHHREIVMIDLPWLIEHPYAKANWSVKGNPSLG